MAQVSKAQVLERLKKVRGPDLDGDIVSLGLVSDIVVAGDKVTFSITVPAERAAQLDPLRQAAVRVVEALDGVTAVQAVLTAERKPARPAPTPEQAADVPPPMQGRAAAEKRLVPGVAAIIAVASGKGGVGKSTTAVNLALALQVDGLRVGILDADIYGPSLPRLLRLTQRPEPVAGRVLKPLTGYGLKVMSMGLLVEEDTAMIWRGPMVIQAITQMLREVAWGELDVLVVDMPPGTGDAQLTMAQSVPLTGAVIVSTPQDLALLDARKGINMFRRVDVPILGIIENMSVYLCPHCGKATPVFGQGGARDEAATLGVPFLGAVPLNAEIRAASDAGTPPMAVDPDGAHGRLYRDIAEQVRSRISVERELAAQTRPNIVME